MKEHDATELAYKNGYERGMKDAMSARWIPVTERLPEHMHDVLVFGKAGYDIGFYSAYRQFWHTYTVYDLDITHWMPFPRAPEEVK